MCFGDSYTKYHGGDPKTVRNGHIYKKNVKQVTKTDFDQKLCVLRGYSVYIMYIHSIYDKSL